MVRERCAAMLAARTIPLGLVMWQIRVRDEVHRSLDHLGDAGRDRKQQRDRDQQSHRHDFAMRDAPCQAPVSHDLR